MMRLSAIIKQFETTFMATVRNTAVTVASKGTARYEGLSLSSEPQDESGLLPVRPLHSCGHRNCPHCQAHESQQWLERQLQKQVPATYFLLTFTLPAELRSLAWHHQRQLYSMMIQAVWQTVRTFAQNDKQLQGSAGAIAVLHTPFPSPRLSSACASGDACRGD